MAAAQVERIVDVFGEPNTLGIMGPDKYMTKCGVMRMLSHLQGLRGMAGQYGRYKYGSMMTSDYIVRAGNTANEPLLARSLSRTMPNDTTSK